MKDLKLVGSIKSSSGNVFADLNIKNPKEALAKAKVLAEIHKIIKKRNLTQIKAARILKISQPKVSLLLRGYFKNFSLEMLFKFLNSLGKNIKISISESHGRCGHTTIHTNSRIATAPK